MAKDLQRDELQSNKEPQTQINEPQKQSYQMNQPQIIDEAQPHTATTIPYKIFQHNTCSNTITNYLRNAATNYTC